MVNHHRKRTLHPKYRSSFHLEGIDEAEVDLGLRKRVTLAQGETYADETEGGLEANADPVTEGNQL